MSVRRSTRKNLGIPPVRYGDDSQPKAISEPHIIHPHSNKPEEVSKVQEDSARSEKKSVATRAFSKMTRNSTIRRRELEIELEAQRRIVELEKSLIQKEMELKKAELDEQQDLRDIDSAERRSHCEDQAESCCATENRVQNWVDDIHDFTNKYTVLSSRSDRGSYPEHFLGYEKGTEERREEVHQKKQKGYYKEEIEADQEERKMGKFLARQSIPKELPIFSGEPTEWLQFVTAFRETTKICGFSDRENIARLQKCLRGKAKISVQALFNFTCEVDKIIDILEKRYGKSEFIINDLIASIRKFPQLRDDKLEHLLDFATAVQNLSVTVTSLNCHQYFSNPQLLSELVSKLSTTLKLEWGKKVSSLNIKTENLNISDFSDWFAEIANAACCVVSHPDTENDRKKKYVCAATEESSSRKLYCLYCKMNNHWTETCSNFQQLDSDRRWEWVKKNKICFCCMRNNHQIRFCRKKKSCNKDGCNKFHHSLLHPDSPREYIATAPNPDSETVSYHAKETEKRVLLRIAPVTLKGPRNEVQTFALFDEGSTITMIDKELASFLGAKGPIDPLRMRWTNSTINEENDSQSINLTIRGQNENQEFLMTNIRTVTNLNLPLQTVNYEKLMKKWKHLPSVNISSLVNGQPKILIGQDNIHLIIAREVIEGGKNSPILSHTKLGWVIHGNMMHRGRVDDEFILHVNRDEELHELVKLSFKIDSLGVRMEEKTTVEESRAMKIMEETARRVGNRWEIGLLWKEDDVKMPKSKLAAENRLKIMEKKLARNPEFSKAYLERIYEYESNGYARRVIDTGIIQDDKLWHLPHFGVLNPKKPGKVRLVFDAASKINGISLNDKLLKGPDFLNSLLGVLFKFRQKKIAFTGDIKDMFHRVYIREEDRQFQRFLWWGENGQIKEYEMTVMIFGAASSPASAQFIMRKNAKEFEEEFPRAAEVILEKHYMDDYLDSVDTVEEALDLIASVEEVHRRGGFHIRNWTSNSKEVLKLIPTDQRAREIKDFEIEKEIPTERVLGLYWNLNEDCFLFNIEMNEISEILERKTATTKRKMLKIVMSVFDPLGFLCSYTVKARILLQEIWKMGSGWDDELEHSINEKWVKWLQDFKKIDDLRIPRCYLEDAMEYSIQLHTFCDSSSKAYAAVSYFRILSHKKIHSSIVMAKSRVCPLKTISIPRLELQGAVLGARLAKTIRENHSIPISRQYFWTDSRTVISWLKSDPRKLKPFVSHRISEILDISEEREWKWISTKQNVADEATRDNIVYEWSKFSRWNIGPSFLRCDEDTWFKENETEMNKEENGEIDEFLKEMKKEYVALITEERNLIESVPKIERFSSYLRLIRSTAWLLRAIRVFRGTIITFSELLPEEVENAERLWLKLVQETCFKLEIRDLKNKKPVERTSRLYKLSPMLDNEGILRINGRIGESEDIRYDTKYPIILDRKHQFTRLLILHYHNKAGHQGQEFVLNELRQKFWILQARASIRSAWNACCRCRNSRAKPIVPEMSPLPKCRVSAFVRPFTFTGMDYFGPMNVTIGRRHEKRYGVLFTCLSVRAVHLEIANSLTTDSTIMAIRRMIGRRGCPLKIFADNGTNLKGAEREMKEALLEMNENQILAEMTTRGIEWVRIPPLTPHMGGCWERMVRSVKTALAVTLKERFPKEEVLSTLLIEAENIVNSRPLVHVPIDAADGEALTPNHFLVGTSSASPLPCDLSESDLVTKKQWKISQYLSDCFWKRWIREYLPSLTRRTKWHEKRKNLAIGDVVMIVDGDLPRNYWLKGVVEAVFVRKDGQVRSADVKTKLGTYRRPTVKLCPLDFE